MESIKHTQIIKGHRYREKGFTLIEVMVAVVVLAIGILAVGSMQVSSVAGNSLAGNTTEAITVGENTLERLIGLPYDHNDLVDGPNNDGAAQLRNPLPPLPAVPIPDMGARPPEYQVQQGRYTVCWNVADNLAVSNTKTINVIVVWQQGSEGKSVVLEYIKARDDLFF